MLRFFLTKIRNILWIYESANLAMKRINFTVIVRPYVCAIGDNEMTFLRKSKNDNRRDSYNAERRCESENGANEWRISRCFAVTSSGAPFIRRPEAIKVSPL